MAYAFAGRSFLGTLGLVFLGIVVLFAIDMFLAKTERAESLVEAARLFEQGQSLMQRGEDAAAIGPIKDSISMERGNRDYLRTLAQAQFAAGKTADAESTLTGLLQSDSGDGRASWIMARVLVKEGRFEDAISYFHRAIYGHWNGDAAGNRLQVRFELIDLLAQRNSKEDLLAELLPVQAQGSSDPKMQARLGRLFLLAGSPARASEVFHLMLHDAPANGDAYAGLGEAEFARADYRAAQRDFRTALRLTPDDPATRQRLDVCDELLLLDPMVRGLAPTERFRRSLKLVELTRNEASRCIGATPSLDSHGLLDKAAVALTAHVSTAHQSEVSESNLDLAEQLWQARKKECKSPPPADSPLSLVMARLAQ